MLMNNLQTTLIVVIIVLITIIGYMTYKLGRKNDLQSLSQTLSKTASPKPTSMPVPLYLTTTSKEDKILDLSERGIEKFPMQATERIELEELNLSSNHLSGSMPSQLGKLVNLKTLNVSNNMLTGIPAEIGHLKNLEYLDLSNNKLTGLPLEMANLKELKLLNLSGNNYSKQDMEIIQKGLPQTVKIIVDK